jgi:hypothetical protein
MATRQAVSDEASPSPGAMNKTDTMEARQRVQLDFAPEAMERLERIKLLAGLKTNAEVIRNALRLYEWFLKQTKENAYKIQLAKDHTVKEVELVF